MSRRITPGAPRFDRAGIPILAAGVLLLAGLGLVSCRGDEQPLAPGVRTVVVTPYPTPPPPGRPELAGGGR